MSVSLSALLAQTILHKDKSRASNLILTRLSLFD